jgi:hypothetical protein
VTSIEFALKLKRRVRDCDGATASTRGACTPQTNTFSIAAKDSGHYRRNMKKLGMILLALYIIVDSLLGFGLNVGPFIYIIYLIGLVAGIFILIGALKSSA